jgi:hypothetical protein
LAALRQRNNAIASFFTNPPRDHESKFLRYDLSCMSTA